ncbi:4'-phosphopantetheinyl transferase [Spongiibacter sp.]|uniref:4'-phosphopantetheinyl transferase family protein n=1 Tax=Spongiibacter sp. TaxID=2024860 RepID=UPI00356566D3
MRWPHSYLVDVSPVALAADLFTATPFIAELSPLRLSAINVTATLCHFRAEAFSPTLFAHYGVTAPDALVRAAAPRQAQFLAGRCAARLALAAIAADHRSPPRGAGGQACWPAGVFGAISHSDSQALCAVGRTSPLGLDIESPLAADAAEELAPLIGGDEEWALLAALPRGVAVALLFSAKESLYKALYPRLQRYIDFAEVRLQAADVGGCCLFLRPRSALAVALPAGQRFAVHWQSCGEQLLTYTRYSDGPLPA